MSPGTRNAVLQGGKICFPVILGFFLLKCVIQQQEALQQSILYLAVSQT